VQAKQLGRCPWALSFSFGRALQQSALQHWAANREQNVPGAQKLAVETAAVGFLQPHFHLVFTL
jgi:fructose-bisphosphate aldolase class I